jgi:zinc metalloprotease ZmpB
MLEVKRGRIDLDDWVWRAKYGLDQEYQYRGLDDVLRAEAESFGWKTDLSELNLERDLSDGRSRHVTYRQTYRGLPVFGSRVKVNLDRGGSVISLISGFRPIRSTSNWIDDVSIGADQAVERAQTEVSERSGVSRQDSGGKNSAPEPGIFIDGDRPIRAWKLTVWPSFEPAEYVVIVSAQSGRLLSIRNQALRIRPRYGKVERGVSLGPRVDGLSSWSSDSSTPKNPSPRVRTTGQGYVFIPDPLSKEGVSYSAPYVDADDASNASLDAARTLVDLQDISTDTNGMFVLVGPYIRITGENNAGTIVYSPPAVTSSDQFQFNREQDGFEAVNAYFHLDLSQRYVQSLGITDRQNAPLAVNPQGLTRDESFFFPDRNMIVFGTGGVDDAEDAGVLWHEYGHALLEAAAPGLLDTSEGVAFHEGWSDYWATSYTRSLAESGAVSGTDWTRVFDWDSGQGSIWPGRVLDHTGHYPEDICSDDPNPGACSPHNDGRLWATALMEVYTELGRGVTDELNLRSHSSLSSPVTFRDAAQAIVQADLDYFSGLHISVLLDIFGNRGLLDPSSFAPSIEHTPLPWIEANTGSRLITAEVVGVSSPVAGVVVHYQGAISAGGEVVMQSSGGTRFEGQFPLPGVDDTVSYYIEATDTGGRTSILPAGAPTDVFSFGIGPDTEAPVMTHEALSNVPLSTWPPSVVATVTDNLGVATVSVSFHIENLVGATLASGQFDLLSDGSQYSADFPVDANLLEQDARVSYQIRARDSSIAVNETSLPQDGEFAFSVSADGLFRFFDFESDVARLQTSGDWERGSPDFGLFTSHSGSQVFGTRLDRAYSSAAGVSRLEISPINLRGVTDALLVFWHWYDTENDGTADPGQDGAVLWDGANVKVSTDGGLSWNTMVPEGGYNGTIASARGNPLSGESAFGGYSYGWRQEIMPLPQGSNVRIRFEMGTDSDNSQDSRFYAGWYLDDISVTTRRPRDLALPKATELPDVSVALASQDAALIRLRAFDDNGIRDVFADFTSELESGVSTGTMRLEMDPSDTGLFSGRFEFDTTPQPGDRISYRLRLIDHSSQVTGYPSDTDSSFEIEYRLFDSKNLTLSASSSDLWERSGSGWTLAPLTPLSEVATLNLVPLDLPDNAVDLSLRLDHLFDLGSGIGGNVKVSTNGGISWVLLQPEGGYPGLVDVSSDHPMNGEEGFVGTDRNLHVTSFDLAAFSGKQAFIRLDFASDRQMSRTESWVVSSIELFTSTREPAFDIQRTFALHAPYPNPFRSSMRVGFTISESGNVEIDLYDLMGRRVRRVINAFYEGGSYEVSVGAAGLSGGSYVLRMLAGGIQKHRLVALIR